MENGDVASITHLAATGRFRCEELHSIWGLFCLSNCLLERLDELF
jgi:hypothetical protein